MRIIFMGTPESAAKVLDNLISSQHEILCVVTQPDRPKGRGQKITSSPVKELALKHALPIEQPEKVKSNPVFFSLLKSLNPDIIIVVAYGKILPKEILDLPKFGCVNIHASLLPKYRGAAPIQWTLLNGEKETGLTIMKLNEGLDTGDIIKQEKVFIDEDDTTPVLTEKLFKRADNLLHKALVEIESGKAKFIKQNDSEASYASLITKELGEIDWKKSALEIHNRIRAMVPWPVAQTYYKEKLLKIWGSKIHVLDLVGGSNLPGTIVEIVKNIGFIVATGNGHLLITEVQAEGKKRMPAYNFVIGHDVKIAETLPN
ncbi:methionyl-tRNA formyltransferase [candidate division WOR-1 bacterium RIFOXYB2_FULL_42_35]|uniref:Methionyl-tRNA formyltransferase n=1 Tax=candidate division WOR-1 bacterium RIFOXYC2_FULL_41_25 TaxID=1802586 RepID=A0A1F4TJX4_UNCSA|nr:MAG: methionyl-tRNA formyltransferase [candidate division WOR-1 bacterium RIFOXYA2_FULL_41_14]OGC23471.1 MAG: methionyl-tRNA formyltransferase [candidate division WOR-1 bacterium RIFOXYB2_FULL_42_35]OGC32994.1 MAG: methionyl-tRNA formyltransferase [candidate division WOR-1 bacterium RIFOXYC2_FULL_41_25]OGC44114.1 MAG: methionyl-tRNA formyltransferase [candidate division WOR-1 bacterium RIFOXYD2_FULL_41_8]